MFYQYTLISIIMITKVIENRDSICKSQISLYITIKNHTIFYVILVG